MLTRRAGAAIAPLLRGAFNAARRGATKVNLLRGARRRLAPLATQALAQKSYRASKALLIGAVGVGAAAATASYFRVYAADQESIGVLPKQGIEKTKDQVKTITAGIESNRLFRLLDEEQKNSLLLVMTRVEFQEGEVILKQGDQGDYFYVIESGQAEVTGEGEGEGVHLRTLGPGNSFGEQGVFLNTARSATVSANSKVVAWVVSKEHFMEYVLPSSSRVRALFDKYASQRGTKGQLLMTPYDFLRALRYEALDAPSKEVDSQSKSRLNYLFDLAKRDQNHPGMSVSEFAVFEAILSKPDSEFDIAFLLFDKGKDGLISKDDVVATLRTIQQQPFRFNESCDLMRRFFGDDGKQKLRFPEFTQFFVNLTEEIPRQLFQFYDKERKGHITGDQFAELLKSFGNWRLPVGVQQRLETLKSLHYDKPVVTYAEFATFNSLLNHLPAMDSVVAEACRTQEGGITRDEFHRVALPKLATSVSPLEVDIVFSIFDVDKDGRFDLRDFRCVMNYGRPCSQEELDAVSAPRASASSASAAAVAVTGPMSPMDRMVEAVKNFGMGAIAGGAGAFAVYPIDLVKTRMQNQRNTPGALRLYRNSFHCFWTVVKSEGPLALYRGLLPQLMGVAPEKAIKLTVNDFLRGLFEDKSKGGIYFPLEVLAGCGAGASQVIFTNPIEIVKIRLQVQGESIKLDQSFKPKGAAAIVRELGFSGLYKGAGACLLRDVPFSGIYFPAYVATKKWLARDKNGKNDATDLLLAGAIAGIPAASLVTPADVIKTRLQVEARKGEQTYSGLRDCFWKVLKQEGPAAFMKGALARVFRSSPQFGVTLLVYEQLHRLIAPEGGYRPPTSAPITRDDLAALRTRESIRNVERFEAKIQTLKS